MIARCPQCATAFRITQAQLEARDGFVRCGLCRAVFDARESVSGDAAARPAPEATNPQSVESAPASPELPPVEASDSRIGSEAPDKPVKGAAALEFGFGPRKKRISRLWWPASALALLALASQLAFYFRGEIALLLPDAKPALNQLCRNLGCEVPLPKRAELMSIETSDLKADTVNSGVMVLSAVLRNRAAFPQAVPDLELTLTDDRDRALTRRVLSAGDYLDRAPNPETGFAANSEMAVKVYFEVASIKPTGYRLYLFYP